MESHGQLCIRWWHNHHICIFLKCYFGFRWEMDLRSTSKDSRRAAWHLSQLCRCNPLQHADFPLTRPYRLHTLMVGNPLSPLKTGSVFGRLWPIECTDLSFPCWIYHLLIQIPHVGKITWSKLHDNSPSIWKTTIFFSLLNNACPCWPPLQWSAWALKKNKNNNFYLHWMCLYSST